MTCHVRYMRDHCLEHIESLDNDRLRSLIRSYLDKDVGVSVSYLPGKNFRIMPVKRIWADNERDKTLLFIRELNKDQSYLVNSYNKDYDVWNDKNRAALKYNQRIASLDISNEQLNSLGYRIDVVPI